MPCDLDLHAMLEGYIPTSIDVVSQQYIGLKVYSQIDSLSRQLQTAAKRVMVLHAIVSGFHRINVEITSSGLAVVQTQNLAPASAERTKKFYQSLESRLVSDRDVLFELLLREGLDEDDPTKVSPWYNTSPCQLYCQHIVALPNDRRAAHVAAYSLSEIDLMYGQLSPAESQLRHTLGNDFVDDIIKKHLRFSLNELETRAHALCCAVVGAYLKAPLMPDTSMLKQLENFILENLDAFPTYANSAIYLNTQSHVYQNQKDDTTFFL